MTKEGKFSRVSFRVECRSSIGQTVAVFGSSVSLGSFSKAKLIPLVTTPEAYPVWYTLHPIVLPIDVEVVYKYCIMENGAYFNQEIPDDDRYVTPTLLDVNVEDVYIPSRVRIESELKFNDYKPASSSKIEEKSSENVGALGNSLYITCYHLPIIIQRDSSPQGFNISWAESLISKSEDSVSQSMQTFWIGTVHIPGGKSTAEEELLLTGLLKAMNCIPIFLPKQTRDYAYRGYCKEVLWPAFHNVDQVESSLAIWRTKAAAAVAANPAEPKSELVWNQDYDLYYAAYQTINTTFADMIASVAKDNDLVWVHDYHLLLLPKLLREKISGLSIVFFNHIPFPTSQILRSLPSAQELLLSLTCADVVGFHTFDYARHFLNACKRMIGYRSKTLPGGLLAIVVGSRDVIVSISHVSIEPGRIIAAASDPETIRQAEEIRAKYVGKKIVVGVDPCQRLSGISLKLAAVDQLLSDNGSIRDSFVLIQKSVRSRARALDESTTSLELTDMVAQLNRKYGAEDRVVVDYEEISSMSLRQRCALWLAADVFLLTCIREGLNMMPLEYIMTRRDLPFAGVVVASEFSNCSALLSGALKVNPFYSQHVADSLDKAILMDSRECAHRRQRDIGFVSSRPSSLWTKQILTDLLQLKTQREVSTVSLLPNPLDPSVILSVYDSAITRQSICKKCCRVFVLDYGGTLLHKEKFALHLKRNLSAISGRQPSEAMMRAVRRLSEDPANVVLVVTGLTRTKLGGLFEDYPNVCLASSNGLVYSWGKSLLNAAEVAASTPGERTWPVMEFNINWTAVSEIAVPIITRFTFRTNGTCLTPRWPGIGWSYFGADPEWGAKQAEQLALELEASLANYDVTIRSQIQGSIEIVPKQLHKGMIVKLLLDRVVSSRAGMLPDFVMVIGDSEVDDDMFESMSEAVRNSPASASPQNASAFSVTVGSRKCNASFYVPEVKDVEQLLSALAASESTKVADDVVSAPVEDDSSVVEMQTAMKALAVV